MEAVAMEMSLGRGFHRRWGICKREEETRNRTTHVVLLLVDRFRRIYVAERNGWCRRWQREWFYWTAVRNTGTRTTVGRESTYAPVCVY